MDIHPTAIVHKKAEIDDGVKIGPFAFIDEYVRIGKNTEVGHGTIITGWTRIGSDCRLHMGVVIGNEAQVKDLKKIKSYLEIGNNNTIREYVTIHRSMTAEGLTSIGNGNLIMANVHIAHDCRIGNNVSITNFTMLAGYVQVEDSAFISALVGIHQFVRVGELAMVAGLCRLTQDVPPYMLIEGHPGRVRGLNTVGLKRAGLPQETMDALKNAYKILFRSGLPMSSALERAEEELPNLPQVEHLIEFIKTSERGVCRPKTPPR